MSVTIRITFCVPWLTALAWLGCAALGTAALNGPAFARDVAVTDMQTATIALRPATQFSPEMVLAWFDSRVGADQDGRFIGYGRDSGAFLVKSR